MPFVETKTTKTDERKLDEDLSCLVFGRRTRLQVEHGWKHEFEPLVAILVGLLN